MIYPLQFWYIDFNYISWPAALKWRKWKRMKWWKNEKREWLRKKSKKLKKVKDTILRYSYIDIYVKISASYEKNYPPWTMVVLIFSKIISNFTRFRGWKWIYVTFERGGIRSIYWPKRSLYYQSASYKDCIQTLTCHHFSWELNIWSVVDSNFYQVFIPVSFVYWLVCIMTGCI